MSKGEPKRTWRLSLTVRRYGTSVSYIEHQDVYAESLGEAVTTARLGIAARRGEVTAWQERKNDDE